MQGNLICYHLKYHFRFLFGFLFIILFLFFVLICCFFVVAGFSNHKLDLYSSLIRLEKVLSNSVAL